MSGIEHVFVVMLENRSFDHMLGFSGITGTDAATGLPTSTNGLTGTESNSYGGQTYTVSNPALWSMPVDPGHEFPDTLIQLTGANSYPSGGPYPPIDNSGFVSDYVSSPSSGEGNGPQPYGTILQGYSAGQLPVLNALANEFVVCDNWFSAIPGPTWPNRFFLFAASSGGLDHSPATFEIAEWESGSGFSFPNGSIFDAINGAKGGSFRIYGDGIFTIVHGIENIHWYDVHPYSDFSSDLAGSYPYWLTYIEPDYGNLLTYANGNSQHPLDCVVPGEAFLKNVYDTLRASSIWSSSMLIVTWDEHGGFYDHVAPPAAVPPDDNAPPTYNMYGFNFAQSGVRVPAIIVSPLIAQNLIDHTQYDHTSVLATVESLFGISALTRRDAAATNLTPLVTLTSARATPATMPAPATPPAGTCPDATALAARMASADVDSADAGDIPAFLFSAMRVDVQLSPPGSEPLIRSRAAAIRTRADAAAYMEEVAAKLRAARGA